MKFIASLVVIGTCTALLLGACANPPQTESGESNTAQSVLFYFHRTLRCSECLNMELFTGALIESAFEDALLDGRLEYVVINLDEPGNEPYADKFNLAFSTLVLADEDKGGIVIRWKDLSEAWEKSLDQHAFQEYVKDEITRWLNL